MPLFPGTFTDNFDLKDALRTIEGIQNVLSISVIHDVDVDKQAFKIIYQMLLIRCYKNQSESESSERFSFACIWILPLPPLLRYSPKEQLSAKVQCRNSS